MISELSNHIVWTPFHEQNKHFKLRKYRLMNVKETTQLKT